MSLPKLFYFLLMVAATSLSVIKLFVYAKLMTPVAFGEVALILNSYTFILYAASFGVIDGFLKLGSLSKNPSRNRLYIGSILFWGGISVGGLSIVVAALLSFIYPDMSPAYVVTILGLCLSAFFFNTLETFFRASQKFMVFASMLLGKAALATTLGAIFAASNQPLLVLSSEIAAFLTIAVLCVFLGVPVSLRPHAGSWERFVKLVRHGVPLLLTNVVKKLGFVADRWVVVKLLGVTVLAQYSFVMLIYLGVISLIGILNAILGPKLLAEFGRHGDLTVMRKTVYTLMGKVSVGLIPLFWAFTVLYPPIVERFFPSYVDPSVYASANYLALGMLFFFLNSVFDWLMIGGKQSYLLFLVNLSTLLIGFASYVLFVFLPSVGLTGFALLFCLLRMLSLVLSIAMFEFRYRVSGSSVILSDHKI